MSDYSQPDFYRFNEDSILLVNEISSLGIKPANVLDMGAGSGVIGIELAVKLEIPTVHFLEVQKDWEPSLSMNIDRFLTGKDVKVFWDSVGSWKRETKYDLIVSNPPYYLPGKGKMSPDPVRAKCRSFLEDSWEIFLHRSSEALNPGGSAFFVTALENADHVRSSGRDLPLEFSSKGAIVIIKLSSEYK